MQNQEDVKNALIDKFEGATNKEVMKKYPIFKNVAEMYSQFRSYLFALAKTHPEETLKLLKSKEEIIVKAVTRGVNIDILQRMKISLDVLEGLRYREVAEKHNVSVASVRVTFVESAKEVKNSIPNYYGKKQIIAEYSDELKQMFKQKINEITGKQGHKAVRKGLKNKSPRKQNKRS